MDKNKLVELVNKDLDNIIDVTEKEILQKEMSTNPEAKKYYDEMKTCFTLLARKKTEEYDIDLSDQVISKLRNKKFESRKKIKFQSFLFYFNSPKVRYVGSFALGAIACFIVLSLVYKNTSGDISSTGSGLSGTMGSIETYGDFKEADYVSIDIPEVKATFNSQFLADRVIAKLKIASTEEVKINLGFNQDKLKLYALKPLIQNNDSRIVSAKNLVQIVNKGDNSFLILFNSNQLQEKISIKIFADSKEIYQNLINTH
ncbi:MAG: hypothetical protein NTX22_18260 [Ignavibacteriales bacterium]|nr:hypothetical protein [Ignavibacteriales bacterium]